MLGTNAQRRQTLTLLGVGLCMSFASIGCKKKSSPKTVVRNTDPMALVPEGATFLMNVNLPGLLASPAFESHKSKFEEAKFEGGQVSAMLSVLRACKLGPAAFARIALAFDPLGHRIVVLRGKGIGEKERWDCLAKNTAPMPWPGFRVHQDKESEQTQLRPKGGAQGRGILVDSQTVVLSEAFWQTKVEQLVAGKAKPAIETQLAKVYANAPTQHQIWFRGELPLKAKNALGRLAPSSDSGLDKVSGGLNLDTGLKLELDGFFGSAQLAQAAQRELSSWLEHLRGSAPMFGLPKTVMKRASLDSRATLLRFQLDINGEEWGMLQRNLSRISAGSRNAPKIPDMFPKAPGDMDAWKNAEKPGQ